jgi:multidrug efflux pump subunit AcrB
MNYNLGEKIAAFSTFFVIKWRFTLLLFIGLLALGYFSFTTLLQREGFPSINVPIVLVQTQYFVGDSEKVLSDVTLPLEESLKEIVELKELTSNTGDNFVTLVLSFDENLVTDLDETSKEVEDIVSKVQLPTSAKTSVVVIDAGKFFAKYDIVLSISGDNSIQEVQDEASEIVKKLKSADFVINAESLDSLEIVINPITGEESEVQNNFTRKLATDGSKEFRPSILIGLEKKGNIDAVKLSEKVHELLDEDIKTLDEQGYSITFVGDYANVIEDQLSSLGSNLISGLIVIIIISLLLINFRASLIIAIFVPTVIATVFLALYLIGYTLNIISLFSLILVLGLFVDDAIIVVESIDKKRSEGMSGIDSIRAAISEIGIADVSGSITTIMVFIPMAFTSGLLGDFIRLIPITVIISLIISLIIALSITTLFSSILLPVKDANYKSKFDFSFVNRFVTKVANWNAQLVSWYTVSFKKMFLILTISILLIIGASSFASQLKF